jgi:spermidine synthase
MWLVLLLFFLSGFSGLVYQVVWVREFGTVFGVTVYSASTVSAVFLLGLGVGGLYGGRIADRLHTRNPAWPLRAYGLCELAIAALGLGVALLLPTLEGFSAGLSHYVLNDQGWHVLSTGSHWLRFGVAFVLLAPISTLMGATLTLLIRHLLSTDLSLAGWRVGALYGLNTAGAAFGAFMTDFALIPNLGIFDTQLVAIFFNALAGVGAVQLARQWRPEASEKGPTGDVPAAPTPDGGANWLPVRLTALALFFSGVAAMGMEILWFRVLISILGGQRSAFSLLLTVILVGIFLGSLAGGWLQRRNGMAATLYIRAQVFFVVATIAALALYDPRTMSLPAFPQMVDLGLRSGLLPESVAFMAMWMQHVVAIAGLPAFLMGFSFPLANAHVQRFEDSVGSRSGALYLANTLGNVVGSLGTGLILLPGLGTMKSATILVVAAMLGVLSFFGALRAEAGAAESEGMNGRVLAAYLAIMGVGLGYWQTLPASLLMNRSVPGEIPIGDGYVPIYPSMVRAVSEGVNETVAVIEDVDLRLFTNGHPMSGVSEASRYMRLFTHIPLINMERPDRALVICFGVGNTLHSASLHSTIERLEVVDLSENVLDHAPYFKATNHGVLDNPLVDVFVNDGRQHLRMNEPGSYDLVTLEPPPLTHAGVASLYSVEFYELVHSRLKEGGALTQWLPAYQVSGEVGLAMVRAFMDVFPDGVLLSGWEDELILIGIKGSPPLLDPARVAVVLEREPEALRDLESMHAGTLLALAATFAGSAETLQAATAGVHPVTDDLPIMEYPEGSPFATVRLAGTLFAQEGLETWCPDCFSEGDPIPELQQLAHLQPALDAYYQSDHFLERAHARDPASWGGVRRVLVSDPCAVEVILGNDYWKALFAEALSGTSAVGCHRPTSPR